MNVGTLKEEITKLQRDLKKEKLSAKGGNEREMAKLRVENEMLLKQIEDLRNHSASSSQPSLFLIESSKPGDLNSDDQIIKETLRSLREENLNLHDQVKEFKRSI